MDKSAYWSIKITVGIFGVIALFEIVPHFTFLLQQLVDTIVLTSDRSPEFNLILICLSIYVTCSIMNTIVNLIFKLQKLITKDSPKGESEKE